MLLQSCPTKKSRVAAKDIGGGTGASMLLKFCQIAQHVFNKLLEHLLAAAIISREKLNRLEGVYDPNKNPVEAKENGFAISASYGSNNKILTTMVTLLWK